VADTADISAVRFVANDPEKAVNVLRSHGYSIKTTDVLAVEAPNHRVVKCHPKPLKEISINVSYLYTCLGTGERTVLIVGVDKMDEAVQVLRKNWVHMFDENSTPIKSPLPPWFRVVPTY
jgi:hypothetical protein